MQAITTTVCDSGGLRYKLVEYLDNNDKDDMTKRSEMLDSSKDSRNYFS